MKSKGCVLLYTFSCGALGSWTQPEHIAEEEGD